MNNLDCMISAKPSKRRVVTKKASASLCMPLLLLLMCLMSMFLRRKMNFLHCRVVEVLYNYKVNRAKTEQYINVHYTSSGEERVV